MDQSVVLYDHTYRPEPGDVLIEIQGTRDRPIPPGVYVIDPQHGGHSPPDPAGWLIRRYHDEPAFAPTLAALATLTDPAERRAFAGAFVGPDGSSWDEAHAAEWAKAHPTITPGDKEWPAVEQGDAACTYARRLAGRWPRLKWGRIVLSPTAGLDDFAAAAVLLRPTSIGWEQGRDAAQRLEAVADADNVVAHAASQDWAPGGQALRDVTATFSGLSRICATREIPLAFRVELIGSWLLMGAVSVQEFQDLPLSERSAYLRALLGEDVPEGGDYDLLPALDRVAIERREAYCQRCTVRQHGDLVAEVDSPAPSGDPSEGQGGLGLAYQHAPVGVAHYPLPDGRRKYTVARAANARGVTFDFAALVAALNEAEVAAGGDPSWNGNAEKLIFGSPRQGSLLAPALVVGTVCQAVVRR